MNMNHSDFVREHAFSNPLQRLIMLRVLMAGSLNGEGERIIDNGVLCDFCCCTKQSLFKEIKNLERDGVLIVRKISHRAIDANARLEPVRGYTINPISGGGL